MVFLRVKGIKDDKGTIRFYVYKVKSTWIKELKPARQKVVGYVGRAVGIKNLTAPQVLQIMQRDNFACQKQGCNRKEFLTIDHKISLLDKGTNDLSNLQVLCSWHNQSKGRGNDSQA